LRIVRAEAQARQGRPEEAEQGIRSIAGDPGVAPQTRVSAWSTIALARESSGDHQGAVEACRAALQVLPDFVEIRYTLARILEERLRLDEEALREYRTYQATGGRNDVRPAIARLEAR
jgi:tetratricopeptide (TPR) repeat protein